MLRLVVARNGDIDEANRSVGVAEANHRDVDVRRLGHRLVIGPRIRYDQKSWLAEHFLREISNFPSRLIEIRRGVVPIVPDLGKKRGLQFCKS